MGSQGREEAIRVSKLLLHPSQPAFESIVVRSFIQKPPITLADVQCANKIFGPSISALKWQTNQKTPDQIVNTVPTAIPKGVREKFQHGVLCIIFFM